MQKKYTRFYKLNIYNNQTHIQNQGSVAMIGFGYAQVMVSTFGRAQSAAVRKGFNDDIDTYLLIAGTIAQCYKMLNVRNFY